MGGVIGGVMAAGACLFFGTGILVALAVAVGVFIFSPILGGSTMIYPGGGSGGGRWGGGGGFGGGSSGGGGFSGGGGSFSGGGASGDW